MSRQLSKHPVLRLDEIAAIERDSVQPEDIVAGTLYVGLEHIDRSGEFVKVRGVSSGQLASSKFRFGPDHLLFGKLRPYLMKTARPHFAGVCSTDIVPILPGPQVDRNFLFHFLRHRRTVEWAVMLCAGANLPRISPRDLASLNVPIPPLSEQRRIADMLDKAGIVRRKHKDALALTEDLRRSTFMELMGPGAKGYAGWPVQTIESLAAKAHGAIRTGPFGSDLLHSEFVEEGIAVLGIDNAVNNRFAWGERRFVSVEKHEQLRRYTVFPGDVIVTIMGTTGRSAVVPDDIPSAITTKHLATITVDRSQAEPEFVSQAIFRHPDVLRQIAAANRGAIMNGLNLGLIKSLHIRVPPVDRQREFASVVERLSTVVGRLETAQAMADDLFQAIIACAFNPQEGSSC